jgi:hypothetical protein
VVLRAFDADVAAPGADVAERLWRAQFPGVFRWILETPFQFTWHFSLLALVRCETQAIDQHWSLHRVAVTLPGGERDDGLAEGLDLAQVEARSAQPIPWPGCDLARWLPFLRAALEHELATELATTQRRQQDYLRRELDRIEDYFDSYERELAARQNRSRTEASKTRLAERLAAAQAERARRRQDQLQRHEIRVLLHFDALLLTAEPAWKAVVTVEQPGSAQRWEGLFVPRWRRWRTVGRPSSRRGTSSTSP